MLGARCKLDLVRLQPPVHLHLPLRAVFLVNIQVHQIKVLRRRPADVRLAQRHIHPHSLARLRPLFGIDLQLELRVEIERILERDRPAR